MLCGDAVHGRAGTEEIIEEQDRPPLHPRSLDFVKTFQKSPTLIVVEDILELGRFARSADTMGTEVDPEASREIGPNGQNRLHSALA